MTLNRSIEENQNHPMTNLLSTKPLSKQSELKFKAMQETINQLELPIDSTEAILASGIYNLHENIVNSKLKINQLDSLIGKLEKQQYKNRELMKIMDDILNRHQVLEPLENHIQQEWEINIEVLSQKQQEYTQRLEYLQDKNSSLESEQIEQMRLNNLRSLDNHVHHLWSTLKEKQLELKSYQDLPPDLTLASLKLEEKKAEWQELMAIKQQLLESMTDSMINP